jgi:uncharacterized protein YdeI (YjbR/CyaY-like superfamily)
MSKANPKVDFYFTKAKKWREEMERLRKIILGTELTEELKWGKPFYTVQGGNVLVIWGYKDHCALGFCKGALLKDADGILSNIGENTQAVRKIRFTSLREIVEMDATLQAYIQEAIEVEKAGLEVKYKETSEFTMPEELKNKLSEMPAFKKAFESLTPGRQRGYLLHFSAPKQSKTRESRIEKCMQRIFDGKGFDERPAR